MIDTEAAIRDSSHPYNQIADDEEHSINEKISAEGEQNGRITLLSLQDRKRKFSILFVVFVTAICTLVVSLSSFAVGPTPLHQLGSFGIGILNNKAGTLPAPFKSIVHPDAPGSLWGSVVKPYPTGAFWTNLVVNGGNGAIGLYPYGVKTLREGIQASYGAWRRIVNKVAITDNFVADLQLSSVESYLSRGVETYDAMSVTMLYTTSNDGKFKAPLVKGSPFITVLYENATPLISSELMQIKSLDARIVQGIRGVLYIATLGNFQKWLVYCSEPVALVWSKNTLTAPMPIHGVVRVAILPAQNHEAAFQKLVPFIGMYPTGASVSIEYTSMTASVLEIKYEAAGQGKLFMFALPHQVAVMVEPHVSAVSSQSEEEELAEQFAPIWCIKGKLRAVVGTVWRLQYTLAQVGWNYQVSDNLSTEKLDAIAKDLLTEVNQVPPNAQDPYGFGKEVGRLARLALIADNLGIADARKTAIDKIKDALEPWLMGSNSDTLVYDTTYGGIVTTNGINDPMGDYGSGWYNDHHFHYGYFLYAAAAVAKIDNGSNGFFKDQAKKAAIDAIVKDICNHDPSNTDFPLARHKDLFDGHSWASGLVTQGNGKGQESSSEAVNAYYGAYLYGIAMGDRALEQFAHLMLTMEIHSVQRYWHMPDSTIYDMPFASARMLGNVGALDVTASTWFGDNPEYIHGINLIPLTPVTAVLFDREFVQVEYPVLAQRLKDTGEDLASDDSASSPTETNNDPHCSAQKECSQLGMEGLCCPTTEGSMLACCDAEKLNSAGNSDVGEGGGITDEWKSLIYSDMAVVDRDRAWNKLLTIRDFGAGNSKSNALYWAASRPPPLANFDFTKSPPKIMLPSSCKANSPCDAIGMIGECCPSTDTGTNLGCCPAMQ